MHLLSIRVFVSRAQYGNCWDIQKVIGHKPLSWFKICQKMQLPSKEIKATTTNSCWNHLIIACGVWGVAKDCSCLHNYCFPLFMIKRPVPIRPQDLQSSSCFTSPLTETLILRLGLFSACQKETPTSLLWISLCSLHFQAFPSRYML